jgi:CRP/FNR family transcriptional regulator, anaerobic regulatory protein
MSVFELIAASQDHPATKEAAVSSDPASPGELRLRTGEFLYQEGDSKDGFFRIEKGTIAVYRRCVGEPTANIEIAVAGDYVGLGCCAHYSENARAMSDCTVARLTTSEFIRAAEADALLKHLQGEAIEREFEARKALLTSQRRASPLKCVAAFLVSVSRQNAHEGRDPSIIADPLECGFVASLLNFDINTLAHCLVQLKNMNVIEPAPDGSLRLKRTDMLEAIADDDEWCHKAWPQAAA